MIHILQRQDADDDCEEHAEDREDPYIAEGSADVILDVDVGEADAEEGRRDHRADEGCAVTADNHGNRDREGLHAEGCADGDHNRKHTIEVGIRIEAECERHGQDADHEWQMLAECRRQDHRDDTGHV